MRYEAQIFDVMQLLYDELGFNDHMVHCELRLGSRLDESILRQATDLALRSLPILATAFRSGRGGYAWEPIPEGERDGAFSAVDGEEGFEAERTFRIREGAGPQLRVGFLRGERSAVAITVNHMLADGAALKELVYFLCDAYSGLREDPGYAAPAIDGYRGMGDVMKAAGARAIVGAIRGRGGSTNRPGELTFPFAGGEDTAPFIATRCIGREKVARLEIRCKALGATINDAVLATCYRSLRRKLGSGAARGLEVPVAVDMRRYLPSRDFAALRNLASMVGPGLASGEDEPFERTIAKAKAAMDGLKAEGIGLGGFVKMAVLDALPRRAAVALMRRGLRTPLICMTNLGKLDSRRLRFEGAEVVSAYACGSIKHKPHFQVGLSGFDGTLTLSSNLYGSPGDRKEVEAFLADMEEELAAET